jgi:hypothetical protein
MQATRRKEPAAYGKQAGFTAARLDLAEREAVFVAIRNVMAPVPATATPLASVAGLRTIPFPPNLRYAQKAA